MGIRTRRRGRAQQWEGGVVCGTAPQPASSSASPLDTLDDAGCGAVFFLRTLSCMRHRSGYRTAVGRPESCMSTATTDHRICELHTYSEEQLIQLAHFLFNVRPRVASSRVATSAPPLARTAASADASGIHVTLPQRPRARSFHRRSSIQIVAACSEPHRSHPIMVTLPQRPSIMCRT